MVDVSEGSTDISIQSYTTVEDAFMDQYTKWYPDEDDDGNWEKEYGEHDEFTDPLDDYFSNPLWGKIEGEYTINDLRKVSDATTHEDAPERSVDEMVSEWLDGVEVAQMLLKNDGDNIDPDKEGTYRADSPCDFKVISPVLNDVSLTEASNIYPGETTRIEADLTNEGTQTVYILNYSWEFGSDSKSVTIGGDATKSWGVDIPVPSDASSGTYTIDWSIDAETPNVSISSLQSGSIQAGVLQGTEGIITKKNVGLALGALVAGYGVKKVIE